MLHPNYVWIFFYWYSEYWWMTEKNCTMDKSIKAQDLEKIVKTSLIFDHYPRIEDEDTDEINVGNIVSNLYKYY